MHDARGTWTHDIYTYTWATDHVQNCACHACAMRVPRGAKIFEKVCDVFSWHVRVACTLVTRTRGMHDTWVGMHDTGAGLHKTGNYKESISPNISESCSGSDIIFARAYICTCV